MLKKKGNIKKVELVNHLRNIKNHYEKHLVNFDFNTPEAVYWGQGKGTVEQHDMELRKLNLRFEILTGIDDLTHKKVLDFGCGNALLKDFLDFNNVNCSYTGWDISEKMIDIAKIRHPEGNFKVVDVLNDDLSDFIDYYDFIMISGVFNGCWNVNGVGIHKIWVREVLSKLWTLCRGGISVNFLMEDDDWDVGAYACKFDDIIPFVSEELSQSFVFRQDYNLLEFTVYIYRES